MKPVPQKGDATGGPPVAPPPVDKPPHQYIANDYAPKDTCHAEPRELLDNDGDFSKKFGYKPAPR